MMSIHEKSIFGGYKCLEDQATAALLHILDIVGPHMVEYVFEDLSILGNWKGREVTGVSLTSEIFEQILKRLKRVGK